VPNATMYVVEGGSHWMMNTHSEEIEEVIEKFFQKTVNVIF
jgi:pimeloyl-ACP methyl ester carboxylesterase